MKDKVEWSSFEKKYNTSFDKIHESYDEILAIRTDNIPFRSQLCRRLPSTVQEKEIMDDTQSCLPNLDELRALADKNFHEVKEEMEYIADKEEQARFVPEPEYEPHMIHGVRLGKMYPYRKLFKEKGIYKIIKELEEAVASDPAIATAYEDYIQRGIFQGKILDTASSDSSIHT
jgi:hypothetical protein